MHKLTVLFDKYIKFITTTKHNKNQLPLTTKSSSMFRKPQIHKHKHNTDLYISRNVDTDKQETQKDDCRLKNAHLETGS